MAENLTSPEIALSMSTAKTSFPELEDTVLYIAANTDNEEERRLIKLSFSDTTVVEGGSERKHS